MKKKLLNATLLSRMADIVDRHSKVSDALDSAQKPKKECFKIANAADGEADLYIYDEISDSEWYGFGAQDLVDALSEIDAKTINVHLNSPGGSVFSGFAIYSNLVSYSEKNGVTINMIVDGWAASIASVIMMAGDHISIGEHASVMIHSPFSWVVGDAETMRAEADVLDELEETIVDIYVARTGGDREEIQTWVKNETWMKGKLAVERGFADEVISLKKKKEGDKEDKAAKPAASRDVSYFAAIFPNMPDDVREALAKQPAASDEKKLPATRREFKNLLREFGYSNKQADAIAGHGFKDKSEVRDEPTVIENPTTTDRRDDAGKRDALAAIRAAAFKASVVNAAYSHT